MSEITRPQYFTGQLLVEGDFQAEQAYHERLRLLHNSKLHTMGVVNGLEVEKTEPKKLKVKLGTAIDGEGREIVLESEKPVDLTGKGPGAGFLTIKWVEKPTDPYTGVGPTGRPTRMTVSPEVEWSTAAPGDKVVTLASVTIPTTGDIVIDASIRQRTGSVIDPTSTLTVRMLKLSIPNTQESPQWPSLSASGANAVSLAGSLSVSGVLNVQANAAVAGSLSLGGAAAVGGGASVGGNLGVGTTAPEDRLHVSGGNIRLDNNRGFFTKDASGVAKRMLLADPSNVLRLGSGGGQGFDRIDFDLGNVGTAMTLSGGRLGIGATAPTEKLQVEAGSIFVRGDGTGLIVDEGANKRVGLMKYPGREAGIWRLSNQDFEIGRLNPEVTALPGTPTAFTPDLVVGGNGNIGIGTAAPGANLHLLLPATPAVLRIQAAPSGFGTGRIEFWSDPQGSATEWRPGSIQSTDNGGFTGGLAFLNNGSGSAAKTSEVEVMRIVNSKVGIGTTTPAETLDVNGRIKSGDLSIGPWPANPNYMFVGTNALDQTNPGNYALLQGAAADKGITFLNSPENIRFRIGNGDRMILTKDGNLGIGSTNPQATLDVAGSIRSSMWNVTQVLNERQGGLPINATFNSGGGTLLIFASGSGWSGAAGGIGMAILIDSVQKGTAIGFTNEPSSHKAFVANALVVTGIAAGSHNLGLAAAPGLATNTDGNDRFSVTILELPWVLGRIPTIGGVIGVDLVGGVIRPPN